MRTRIVLVASVVVLGLLSGVRAGEIPDCVGAWSFDEGNGTAAADASSSKNDGTLTGAPKWVEGKSGKAVSLDGQKDCIVLKQDLLKWLGKTGSLSCWIKTKATGNETFWQAPAITGVEEAGGGNDIFWGWIDDSGKIGIQAGDAEGAKSSNPITDDKWHHVAFTRNMDSGEVKVYVDGKVAGTATSDTGEKTSSFNALGRRENTGGDATFLQGSLDEVRIYSRVLTDAEVEKLSKGEK
ncbi:MAG: LamG domain-containing protein [Planctomycetota bacterium]|nr:LamG domain-containing protein [Planctomycetota bacterium]